MANVLLARWLSPVEYGAFALGYTIFLLLAALHTAVLTDPMLIFGAGRYRHQLNRYLWFLFACHVGVSIVAFSLLGSGAWLARSFEAAELSRALWGVALASPLILFAWLLRRAFYIDAQPARAALGSLVYLFTLLGGLVLLWNRGLLSAFSAFLAMGVASLVVSAILIILLNLRGYQKIGSKVFGSMLANQWSYARWSGPTSFLIWIPLNVFFVAITYSSSLEGAASLRALTNLLTPMMQSTLAISNLVIPDFSRIHIEQGKRALLRRATSLIAPFLAISLSYWALLWLLRTQLFSILYGGHYLEVSGLLLLAGSIPVAFGIAVILESTLRALERPQSIFRGYLLASIAAGTIGVFLTIQWQLPGAILGQIFAFVILALSLLHSLRKT